MKRAIKFRGKRAENGEWCYGSLLVWPDGECTILEKSDNSNVMWKREIDPDTVGQFTGVHDCKGREIYEGDILFMGRDNGKKIYNEVGIKYGCFGYIGEVTGKLIPFCNYDVTENIAGNVHDNHELLEGGQNG